MAAKFAKDAPVRQKLPAPVNGTVKRFVFDETSGDIIYIVVDANGQEWSFDEADIEAA